MTTFYPQLVEELIDWFALFFGIISILFSLYVFRTLFSSLKVMTGTGKTIYLSPILEITSIKEDTSNIMVKAPETGKCSFCDRDVYKPFVCTDCKQLFCGMHILPGDHNCRKRP
ncbi:MAG: AN1-type zinc finger protein [Candidatus Odinarchaeota archaeon]